MARSTIYVPGPRPHGGMARIPEATFPMGSETGEADEKPVHTVHVDAFDMDVTEVTVSEYASCVNAGACVAVPTTVAWSGITSEEEQSYAAECNGTRPDRQDHIWEWTASPYCSYDHAECHDARRVVRGGSWLVEDHLFVRLTDRAPSDPSTRNTNLGFRC